MSYEIILMLFAAGLVAGGINAIAGGSTLFTFPVLMAAGLPPTVANASNFVAVLPGNAAAIPAYARELGNNRTEAVKLLVASLSGWNNRLASSDNQHRCLFPQPGSLAYPDSNTVLCIWRSYKSLPIRKIG